MKVKNIFVLLLLFFVVVGLNQIMSEVQSVEDQGLDNYGILKGKIIDEDTGKLVYEKFFVSINEPNSIRPARWGTETDKNGIFKCKWKPGTYLLYFFPKSRTSKYCWDRNINNFPEERFIVKIEKGKITAIVKKAKLAGRLRLTMISKEGDKINPEIIFGKKADCTARIEGKSLTDNIAGSQFTNGDDFNDGEILVHCLYPDTYTINVTLDSMGVGSILLKDILINKTSITEVKVIIDFYDSTGIHGVINFESGESIENVEVSTGGPLGCDESLTASVYTDKNGYYKIVGLKEGIYFLTFLKEMEDLRFLNIPPKKITVKNGTLSRIDVKLKNRK